MADVMAPGETRAGSYSTRSVPATKLAFAPSTPASACTDFSRAVAHPAVHIVLTGH